jgi:serine/threonine-protein kinase RsbW
LQRHDALVLDQLRLPAVQESLESFREFVLDHATGLSPEVTLKIDLVLEELLLNVFNYAYGPDDNGTVEVECGIVDGLGFVLRVRDSGKSFNPLAQPRPDVQSDIEHRERGGLGILLVQNMSVSQHYRCEEGSNVLEVVFATD